MSEVQTRNGLYGFEFRDVDLRRSENRKAYDVKQLWQRSHEIINLAARGFKNVDIAKILNVCPATVSATLNGELGSRKLSEIRYARDEEAKVTAEKIRVLTDRALEVYHEIFDNERGDATVRDRKDVADTVVLELSGLRAPTKSISAILTSEDIEALKSRGREVMEQEPYIDTESVDEPEKISGGE